jgi:hypothetical protein
MRNAQYLRAQAEFCLQAARRISDHKTVENLKVDAARYHAEATEVEAEHRAGSNSEDAFSLERDHPADLDFGSRDEKRAYFRLLPYLLGKELQASYERDQPRALPSRMVKLLKALEEREPPETH